MPLKDVQSFATELGANSIYVVGAEPDYQAHRPSAQPHASPTADRDLTQDALVASDRYDLEVTTSQRRHVPHQQVADEHTFVRPRSIRADTRKQYGLLLLCLAGTRFGKRHVTTGVCKGSRNESAARLPAGVSRCNHDRITLL